MTENVTVQALAPLGGVALIRHGFGRSGAVQIAVSSKIVLMLPHFADHLTAVDAVNSTCSFTPTVVRELDEPSGAATRVRVVIVQGGGAGFGGLMSHRINTISSASATASSAMAATPMTITATVSVRPRATSAATTAARLGTK